MTDVEGTRPRMIPGLLHRWGDELTVEQLLAREAAARERAALSGDFPPALPGWGALAYAAHRTARPAAEPNVEPWAHLGAEVAR